MLRTHRTGDKVLPSGQRTPKTELASPYATIWQVLCTHPQELLFQPGAASSSDAAWKRKQTLVAKALDFYGEKTPPHRQRERLYLYIPLSYVPLYALPLKGDGIFSDPGPSRR